MAGALKRSRNADTQLLIARTLWRIREKERVTREADTSLQLTLYSWAYRMIFGAEEKTLKTIALLKTAKPMVQVVETCRTAEDHSRLMELISQVIRGIELRVFYRNPATRYGCDGCVYRVACGGV